jgi:hypothetical protein
MPLDLIISASIALPPLILGSIALAKCDRKDIPEIMRWIFNNGSHGDGYTEPASFRPEATEPTGRPRHAKSVIEPGED